jgi:phage tail sheath protein FI
VSRVVGPASVNATANILDQSGSVVPGDVALVATAVNAGAWANSLNFEVTVTGSDFEIIVSHDDDGELERSGLLADRAAAVAWSATSDYITLTLGASNEDPRAQGPTGLTTGTDDRASITDAQWLTALNVFSRDLGPGQVLAPGRTTTAGHGQLLDHAEANNRVALLDLANTAVVATLEAAIVAIQSRADARYGQVLAPWAVIPGIVPGTTRTVPYSAVQAGLYARSDRINSPNVPVAGQNGQARFVIDLAQSWSDDDRETLNDAGIAIAKDVYGAIQTYGLRSAADPEDDPLWLQFPGARLLMAIRAECAVVAERKQFAQIDGKGLVFRDLQSDLEGEVLLPYFDQGSLYGETPEEAFRVDTGAQVNTAETIAAGEIRAAVGVRTSPGAELVYIQIARQAITQPL